MPDRIDPDFVQEMFPTLSEMTYLDNAATGIPPMTCVNAMNAYLEDRITAKGDFEETLQNLKEIREHLAKMLGGKRGNYGFMPNTTSGLNAFAHSIEYPEGSNIVLCDLEFPANYVPWQHLCRLQGLELRVVKSTDGAAPTEAFKEQVDENTRVLAISQVQFESGFRSDLRVLGKIIHSVGGFLVADIIQAAGWANTNLVKEEVDFAAGQAAKWMLGPIGAGYVYVSDKIIDELRPKYLGWWGIKGIEEYSYFEREPFPDAKKFQIGSPAMIAYVGMLESLRMLNSLTAKARESAALEISEHLRGLLQEKKIGYYEFQDNHKSPIVSCLPEDVEDLNRRLKDKRIHCSVRNGRLRVSPHFYNSKEDIDRLVEYMG
ncbi:MAG: aminotransferase class V-fold PLP-dependent enzyme [Candidatus Thorarchaeota archaeon]|jgi:selenocysteine lyase/cysteine desulfurase